MIRPAKKEREKREYLFARTDAASLKCKLFFKQEKKTSQAM
jgi:hypothetical protein